MTVYRTEDTYVCVSTAFTPPATPTDMFTITGSALTNVYVVKMGLSVIQTTAGANAFFIAKRSTDNVGGTFTNPAVVNYQETNLLPTAIVSQYSVNPAALGTLEGYVWGAYVNTPAPATAGIGTSNIEVDFIDLFGEPISLVGATETLGWNFKGAALPPGLSVIAYVVWYEKSKT